MKLVKKMSEKATATRNRLHFSHAKYLLIHWDGWNYTACAIHDDEELHTFLRDDSFEDGDFLIEVKSAKQVEVTARRVIRIDGHKILG